MVVGRYGHEMMHLGWRLWQATLPFDDGRRSDAITAENGVACTSMKEQSSCGGAQQRNGRREGGLGKAG